MNGKPKIALCISGEPRSSMFCFPYVYESLLNPTLGFDIDVYIHSFKPYRAIELYSPLKCDIDFRDDYKTYGDYAAEFGFDMVKYHDTPFRNTFLMYYGIYKVFNLTKGVKYDYYIRLRPDVMFHRTINLEYIINSLRVNSNDMWVSESYTAPNWQNIVNDQFAVCNPKSFEIYANTINHLSELILETNSFYPEGLLSAIMKKNNIKIERGFAGYCLVRKTQTISFPQKVFLDE